MSYTEACGKCNKLKSVFWDKAVTIAYSEDQWCKCPKSGSRDTQFQGFAKALLKEIVDDMLDEYGFMERDHYESGDLNTTEELITRRAYDLAFHSIDHTLDYLQERGMKTPGDMGKGILSSIPDMPELPDDDKRYAEMQEEEQE